MSLTMTKPAQTRIVTDYRLDFYWRDDLGSGFSFPCDAHGVLHPDLPEPARANFQKCVDGTYDVIPQGIVALTRTIRHPAEGTCRCGRPVVLDPNEDLHMGGIDCPCGRIYNIFGQELKPRHLWTERD